MSELSETINRLEAWVRNYGHEKQPAFIADLKVLIGAAKAVSRAVELLQGLEDVTVTSEDGHLELMVCAHAVDHAVGATAEQAVDAVLAEIRRAFKEGQGAMSEVTK